VKNEDLIPNQSEENVEKHTAELVKSNEQLYKEINKRKRVEAILKESEERYHALYDLIPFILSAPTEGVGSERVLMLTKPHMRCAVSYSLLSVVLMFVLGIHCVIIGRMIGRKG
jgi:PAS domain-containing protein